MGAYIRDRKVLYRTTKSKNRLQCDTCPRYIEIGKYYTRVMMPPNGDMGNLRWWSAQLCSLCLEVFRLPGDRR